MIRKDKPRRPLTMAEPNKVSEFCTIILSKFEEILNKKATIRAKIIPFSLNIRFIGSKRLRFPLDIFRTYAPITIKKIPAVPIRVGTSRKIIKEVIIKNIGVKEVIGATNERSVNLNALNNKIVAATLSRTVATMAE